MREINMEKKSLRPKAEDLLALAEGGGSGHGLSLEQDRRSL